MGFAAVHTQESGGSGADSYPNNSTKPESGAQVLRWEGGFGIFSCSVLSGLSQPVLGLTHPFPFTRAAHGGKADSWKSFWETSMGS